MSERSGEPVSLTADQARRMAVAAQGFADPRPSGRVDRRHLRKVFERIGVIQIDSVNVLVRSQELPLFARLGPHPRNMLPDALEAGELFEYWAHMAAIVPTAHHPLYRWRMDQPHHWQAVARLGRDRPTFIEDVFERIRRDGPLTAADLEQRVGPKGPWWDWDDGKIALEELFLRGRVVARRRRSDFARLYDLPERLLPASVLTAPTPTEAEGRKALLDMAGRALGVATLEDLADYHRQGNQACRPLVAELVEAGRLRRAVVEGWNRPGVRPRRGHRAAARHAAGRCSARSTRWCGSRDRTERLFDFHYRIEIYTPPPKRVYGYYVLPFLLDGQLVGRVDLKADRANGVLRVQGAFAELGVPLADVGRRARRRAALDGGLAGPRCCRRDRPRGAGARAGPGRCCDAGRRRRLTNPPRYAPDVSGEPVGDIEPLPTPAESEPQPEPTPPAVEARRLPPWVVPAVVVFWGGFLVALALRYFWGQLYGLFVLLVVSVFLSLAIEPGVNRLARRGWRRGTATALILFGVAAVFLVFVVAIGALVGTQLAELLQDSETYIRDTVDAINDTFGTNLNAQEVIDEFNDPDGAVQTFIRDQQDNVVSLSVAALGFLLQLFSVLLFTFYIVADGPKLRRAICSRFTPARQERILATWELAGNKTGGYLYSRRCWR